MLEIINIAGVSYGGVLKGSVLRIKFEK